MDGQWECDRCTLINESYSTRCLACNFQRPRTGPSVPNVSNAYPGPPCSGPQIGFSTAVCPDVERRIVFLGRTGSGKSATGNNILNKMVFESSTCGSSVTRKCQRGTAVRFQRNIQIIDSPGLFDTEMTNAEITKEVVKCVAMTAPGPHAFVLVVRIDRFTKEEQDTVQHFRQVFGEGMLNYLIILFTRKDDLIHERKTLAEYLQRVPQDLKDLLQATQNRCIAFNNRGPPHEREQDVQDFLHLIDRVLMDNGGQCYTSEMYAEAEKNMKKREEELKREHERKVQMERDAIRKEYEKKMKRQQNEQSDMAKQMQKRIDELEEEKARKQQEESEAEVEDLTRDVQDLRQTLKEMKQEKEKEERRLEEERERKEREAEKRMEAEEQNYRETAREEVNKEKSGFMSFLGSVLPTLVGAVLPSFVPAAGKLLLKLIKR